MPKESIQSKFDRVHRPQPRLRISYLDGAGTPRELPSVVGVLGDFAGTRLSILSLDRRRFLEIDRDNFDVRLAEISPELDFLVPNMVGGKADETLAVHVQFKKLEEFSPAHVARKIPMFGQLLRERGCLPAGDVRLSVVDQLLSTQLSAVMHAEAFQRLEAAWRGLWFLVSNTETCPSLKVRMLSVSRDELEQDRVGSRKYESSELFRKVYLEEFGDPDGQPYTCLVGDYEFGRSSADVALLSWIGQVASAAHAPFIGAASPSMFGLESFAQIDTIPGLTKLFDDGNYADWNSFRDSDQSRYVCLTLPKILLRTPYVDGAEEQSNKEFQFAENPGGSDRQFLLWGNCAWALAMRIADSIAKFGWPACFRGVEAGGLAENLPSFTVRSNDGQPSSKRSVDAVIEVLLEDEIARLGFIPLSHCDAPPGSVFYSAQSCHRPKLYGLPEIVASARISCGLPHVLCISRFIHPIKMMTRWGKCCELALDDLNAFLKCWIEQFAPSETNRVDRSRTPLRDVEIRVTDEPGRPGCVFVHLSCMPYYMLEGVQVQVTFPIEQTPASCVKNSSTDSPPRKKWWQFWN